MSKKICRNSSRTLRRGCSAPPSVGWPAAAKLYCLNEASFHDPLVQVSNVTRRHHKPIPRDILGNHVRRQVGLELLDLGRKVGSLFHRVVNVFSAIQPGRPRAPSIPLSYGERTHFGVISLRFCNSLMIAASWSPFSSTTRSCVAVVSSTPSTWGVSSTLRTVD